MVMDHRLTGLFNELEKIAVSHGLSTFPQARKGRRSIRADTLLKRDVIREKDEDEHAEEVGDHEAEAGQGMDTGTPAG